MHQTLCIASQSVYIFVASKSLFFRCFQESIFLLLPRVYLYFVASKCYYTTLNLQLNEMHMQQNPDQFCIIEGVNFMRTTNH